ncbi:Sodium/calcium exchanger protein-domain-containing protein [Emericellopsis atlantica]|uniref:Sodium/calcium exchanger protein-domain-containing protein n=1 Tax=Emericellopsis atlantica TaxID=2614577 RepID=A0A9P8CQU0_9HYPO|nr:Sodium/calcium exchanger protein-domain-containing protein [Emericellopsis atlantica]KAG9256289.1 Sodium/calcium exchanger protein-domain-containing protein [Emericellopsis atlantica]
MDSSSHADDQPAQHQQHAESENPSQTDSRNSNRAQGQGLSESFHSTDTIRRRPEGYGTVANPAASGSRPPNPATPQERSRSRQEQPAQSPQPHRAKSYSRLRKPPMPRRISSTTPHRGAVFSADDGPTEVEADAVQRGAREREATNYGTRRRAQAPPSLSRVHSRQEETELDPEPTTSEPTEVEDESPEALDEHPDEEPSDERVDSDDDSDVSDAESFTLKDRQQAINQTHPFGIRVWKPALYKKDRSIQKSAQADIHSTPGGRVNSWLLLFNLIWTLAFGWWMASFAALGAIVCLLFAAAPSGREYGRVLWGVAGYLFYPFGKFVRLEKDEAYLHEDQDEGRSISEYEQWQQGDLEYGRLFFGPESENNRSIVGRSRRSLDSEASETESLLGRRRRGEGAEMHPPMKRRLFGRGEWNIGRVIFFVFFYGLISPSLLIVSAICWFLVFWIPMGKVTILLFSHLRRHPLALSFEPDISYSRSSAAPDSSILLCTYRAVGSKYWKYTIDGTNIFLINLMAVVVFVIFDWAVIERVLHVENFITSPAFLFTMGLLSIIPLAYFIGQAVASISAQSSMGLGAAVNAFFATVVEVFLYCVALSQGKGQLVEGSIVGSIFAGILFLPGLSMCFGALKRKTQRFNAKSAGVTSTMLLFAVVGAFGPTLFYQIYGTHELQCLDCDESFSDNPLLGGSRDCRKCYFSQVPALNDRFYLEAVRPYCYMAASLLFLSYLIGLWFTLRTHAAVIWNAEAEEKRHEDMQSSMVRTSQPTTVGGESTGTDIRDTQIYKRILGQSLKQAGMPSRSGSLTRQGSSATQDTLNPNGAPATPHVVPPKDGSSDAARTKIHVPGLSEADNRQLVREVAEIAATAATLAQRERQHRKHSGLPHGSTNASATHGSAAHSKTQATRAGAFHDEEEPAPDAGAGQAEHGGHDAPNWSRTKSTVILLAATVMYAIIAEILVDTVDVVLESFAIDQKFLGITLFALVPNTTEFLNAISFAMNGNIALSMEIGSAYALQVCLLQIPALVLYSAVYHTVPAGEDVASYTFSLLFPQWDMVTVILCVFLLSYVYGEGKSNYFKGSILVLTYVVVLIGYYFSGFMSDAMGEERFDTMGTDGKYQTYRTMGRTRSGHAF